MVVESKTHSSSDEDVNVAGTGGNGDVVPECVKKRINALKNVQLLATDIEVEFFKELHAMEVKYAEKFTPIFEKRAKIINGEYEPSEEECEWKFTSEEDSLYSEFKEKLKLEENGAEDGSSIKGVPNFWLTTFKNAPFLCDMVEENDEPILSHLKDIKCFVTEEPMKFLLEFHFSPNEYFNNAVLTKEYFMKNEPEEKTPIEYDGPEITSTLGCAIDWKQGKNVTVRRVTKKQKRKGKGSNAVRTVVKTVKTDSFFNFFSPPQKKVGADAEEDEDTENLLNADYEVGHFIKERLIPKALLYFTGAFGPEYDDEEEGEEEEEDEEDTSDEFPSEDEEHPAPKKSQHKGKSHAANQMAAVPPGDKPADCKQQ